MSTQKKYTLIDTVSFNFKSSSPLEKEVIEKLVAHRKKIISYLLDQVGVIISNEDHSLTIHELGIDDDDIIRARSVSQT